MANVRSEELAKRLSQIGRSLSESAHEAALSTMHEESERTNASALSDEEFRLLSEAGRRDSGSRGSRYSASKVLASRVKYELRPSSGSIRKSQLLMSSEDFTLNKLNWSDVRMEGREEESAELLGAFEQFLASTQAPPACSDHAALGMATASAAASNIPAVMVSITGVSGSGKTLLARSLRPAVTGRSCFFVEGKFDLQQRMEPYTALLAAFKDLTEQILTKDDAFVVRVSERIKDAVGIGVQVLTDFVPSLSKLLDDGESSSSLRRTQTGDRGGGVDTIANRVQFVFRQFMRAVCAADANSHHPVVMCLDDMQWADTPSLQLLESLICDVENPYLMLVTTCRENEGAGTNTFKKKLEFFEERGVKVHRIEVGNLDSNAVNLIVSKALRSSTEVTKPLAELVHHKTMGNAFAVSQFLNCLVQEDLLGFSYGTMAWKWNSEKIRAMVVTDNVAGLMVGTLKRLPRQRQLALQVASCLGESFEGEILELVMEKVRKSGIFEDISRDFEPVHDSLDELADAGLLERLSFSKFSFAHDQIQSAAFSQIPKDRRPLLKLRIGERLLKDATQRELNERLFLAVDLCNASISLLGAVERQGLAKYNLLAGEVALKKSAFASAMKYMECGLYCLGSDAWSRNYNLTLDLSSGVVEAAYCSGNFETMQQHMDRVIGSGGAFEGKIRVYLTRILSLGVQERFHEAVDTGLFLLKKMNMANFSRSPGMVTVLKELAKTKLLLRKYSSEALCNLPVVADEKRIQAMGIIMMMTSMAFVSSPNLFVTMFLKAVRWSVKYGVCVYSPTAFATYGVLLIGVLGDVKEAATFGEVALALSDRLDAREMSSQTITTIHGYIAHWTNGLHESLKPLLYGHQIGMETGEVEMAMHNLQMHDIGVFTTASSKLDELSSEVEEHLRQMTEYKQEAFANFSRPLLQVLLNLRGQSRDPRVLTGRAMNQEEMTQLAIETNNRVMTVLLLTYRVQLAFLFGDYESVVKYSDLSMDFGSEVMPGHIMATRHFFYRGLAALALAAKGDKQKKNLGRALEVMKMMKKWISNGNVNCLHKVKLLEAEIAAVKKNEAAAELYGEAVLTSGRACYLQDKALSHYRAGIYYLSKDDGAYWMAYHFDNAIQCYHDWGATALVDQLVNKYGELLARADGTSSLTRNLIKANSDTGSEPSLH